MNPDVMKILIVEDDYETGEIMRAMVSQSFPDLEVVLAGNGKTGLERYCEQRPEIVITDINMPKVDGVSMTAAIRELDVEAKVIVVTGYSFRLDELNGIAADHRIVKPIRFQKLFAAIRSCIEELRDRREHVEAAG